MNPAVGTVVSLDGLEVEVHAGPSLLAGLEHGPSLMAHRALRGDLAAMPLRELLGRAVHLHGRGGAGFPLARKLEALTGARRPPVVVNAAEGEPASAKDAVLMAVAPHLVLDGAAAAAGALGSREVHVVVPEERPTVGLALTRALAERSDQKLRFQVHRAQRGFVSGQSSAVLELIAGRANKPTTAWVPATVQGLDGRPTLLANAETFAHLGARVLPTTGPPGLPGEVGTTLLTVDVGDGRPVVCEVELGVLWRDVLGAEIVQRPVLLGGYHGCWLPPGALQDLTVSRRSLGRHGFSLGAGVVLVPVDCPVDVTVRLVDYLASESAGRCGPCVRGLPTLARLVADLALGHGEVGEVRRVAALVDGRGACAHPDGTARLVRSLLAAYGAEVDQHTYGRCQYPGADA
jgi:NADH:ubiquinone oxidoreductase subunit F (NADH-binding)